MMPELVQQSRGTTETSLSLLGAVEVVVGRTHVIDTSFPRASLWADPMRSTQAFDAEVPGLPEHAFLMRFRQAGGHVPILPVERTEAMLTPNTPGGTIVIAPAAAGSPPPVEAGALLLRLPTRQTRKVPKAFVADYDPIFLIERGGRVSYALLVPKLRAEAPTEVLFDLPTFGIDARAVIHDGGYRSEGDTNYSWLWTGPSTHFRIVLPNAGGVRPRRAEVCLPRSEDPANLELMRVQVDGRPVSHRLDRWSETSGKIVVEIPEDGEYCVLTLVVPRLTTDSGSGRLLGVCLDRLILTP